jgi:hypothetical protein
MARKRKPKQHVFKVGDLALYIYEQKERSYVIPVRIKTTSSFPINPDVKNRRQLRYTTTYLVTTATGGIMTAGPESLRPDTVLDRLELALANDA